MNIKILLNYNWINLMIQTFRKKEIFLRDKSWDDTRLGKYLESFGKLVDDTPSLWGWRKIPVPLIKVIDENMDELIKEKAYLHKDKIVGHALYWVKSHALPSYVRMRITENLPLHPQTTTQIILTKLAGSENIYVANDISSRFFKNNQRFRYPLVEIKPAYPGSGRRSVSIKLYQINPDVVACDVPIEFLLCYEKHVETFQGFLEPDFSIHTQLEPTVEAPASSPIVLQPDPGHDDIPFA